MCKILLKANVANDEGNGRNDMWTLNKEIRDETGVAVQIWLWVRVGLMAC